MFWKNVSVFILSPTIHEKVNFHSLANLSLIHLLKFTNQKGGNISLMCLFAFIRLLKRLKKIHKIHWPFICLWWWPVYIFLPISFQTLSILFSVSTVLWIFYIQISLQICVLKIDSPTQRLVFLFFEYCLSQVGI